MLVHCHEVESALIQYCFNFDCLIRMVLLFFLHSIELNPKCWLKTIGPCEDASKCQWYYNNDNQRCEPGMGGWEPGTGGYGFSSLNDCYDTCSKCHKNSKNWDT